MTRNYAEAVHTAGDRVELEVIPGGGHMDCTVPDSAAFAATLRWIDSALP